MCVLCVHVCVVCMQFNKFSPFCCPDSHCVQAKSERSWILKILVDGLRTEEDYLLYKRHGVFTSAMAFWESAVSDPQAKVTFYPPHTRTRAHTACEGRMVVAGHVLSSIIIIASTSVMTVLTLMSPVDIDVTCCMSCVAQGLILQLLDMAVQLRVALVDLVKRRDLFGWIHRGLQSTR